jgi:hypothetical protein
MGVPAGRYVLGGDGDRHTVLDDLGAGRYVPQRDLVTQPHRLGQLDFEQSFRVQVAARGPPKRQVSHSYRDAVALCVCEKVRRCHDLS